MGKILRTEGMNKCIGCFSCMLVCAAVNQKNHSITKSAIKIRTIGGMEGKFYSTVCLGCISEIACAEACPSGALMPRDGGGVVFSPEKCIGCKRCETACIAHAVFFDDESKKPIICKHCGVCVNFCPHECLEMEG
jgi:carbon-monoxide dehydrogenase iron sulfur subunit